MCTQFGQNDDNSTWERCVGTVCSFRSYRFWSLLPLSASSHHKRQALTIYLSVIDLVVLFFFFQMKGLMRVYIFRKLNKAHAMMFYYLAYMAQLELGGLSAMGGERE